MTTLPQGCDVRHRAASALFSVAVLGLVSCGGETGSEATNTTSTVESERAAAVERLDGRYAHYDIVAYESPLMKTMIVSYGFTDLEAKGDELIATESFCFSENRTDQPIEEVKMADAATQAIKPKSIAVELEVADGVASFFRPETPTGIGIDLENPETDVLPTDPNDPRIADDDGDGKPAVTANIIISPELKGELYIARREIFAYDVEEQPDGSLVGVVHDRSEQLIVGASDPMFISDDKWVQHEDRSKSPIILKPVDSSWDCDMLRAERDDMFPPTPDVDY